MASVANTRCATVRLLVPDPVQPDANPLWHPGGADASAHMELKSVSDITDLPVSVRKKATLKAVEALMALEEFENPSSPTEAYLDERAGKYVRMLEALVDMAASMGLYDLTAATLFGLLKMTKVGRQKTDVTIGSLSKLREEADLSELPEEEIKKLLRRT